MYWNAVMTIFNVILSRLTLTWDVLKWLKQLKTNQQVTRLTLTWDVLKWGSI